MANRNAPFLRNPRQDPEALLGTCSTLRNDHGAFGMSKNPGRLLDAGS